MRTNAVGSSIYPVISTAERVIVVTSVATAVNSTGGRAVTVASGALGDDFFVVRSGTVT